mgnify:CR=1 FL=1
MEKGISYNEKAVVQVALHLGLSFSLSEWQQEYLQS